MKNALTYTFFGAGATGWLYLAVVAAPVAPVGALACGLLALVSAASPWVIEELETCKSQ